MVGPIDVFVIDHDVDADADVFRHDFIRLSAGFRDAKNFPVGIPINELIIDRDAAPIGLREIHETVIQNRHFAGIKRDFPQTDGAGVLIGNCPTNRDVGEFFIND